MRRICIQPLTRTSRPPQSTKCPFEKPWMAAGSGVMQFSPFPKRTHHPAAVDDDSLVRPVTHHHVEIYLLVKKGTHFSVGEDFQADRLGIQITGLYLNPLGK